MSLIHKPVLVEEVVRILQPMDKSTYIDCTIGGAGHALRILESSKPKGFLIGIDTDREALELAKENLKNYKGRFELINDRFERLTLILNDLKIKKVDGILFDLGMSSIQLDDPDRGFSFKKEGKLDMRFSKKQELDAYYLVNNYSSAQLEEIIRKFGEERWAKRIANNIVKKRSRERIESTLDLSEVIKESIPKKFWSHRIDVSTKTFQAIRIAVNQELENLGETIRFSCDRLNINGRIVVITYHSLEDRIVKNTFKELSSDCICPSSFPECVCNHVRKGNTLTFQNLDRIDERRNKNRKKKNNFLLPCEQEIRDNPRSRSAKIRAFMRTYFNEN